MNIAIIPARGGSKRIARKNIRFFDGKPMIAYAIEAAKKSELFSHILVSTDDAEISAVAQDYGAEIPFSRPVDLADDHTPTAPVIAHAVSECRALGWNVDYACCIYPCTPFLQSSYLEQTLELLKSNQGIDYAFPVAEFPSTVQRALKRDEMGAMSAFFPEYQLTRTQDLEPLYHDAGQFYWGSADAWNRNPQILASGVGLKIPHWRVVDIDTEDDWQRAELLYKVSKQEAAERQSSQ